MTVCDDSLAVPLTEIEHLVTATWLIYKDFSDGFEKFLSINCH